MASLNVQPSKAAGAQQYLSSAYNKDDVVFSMQFEFAALQLHRVSTPSALRPYVRHDILWNQFIDRVCFLFKRIPLPFYLALGSLFCDIEDEYSNPRYGELLHFFREQKVLFHTLGLDVIYDSLTGSVVFVKVPRRPLMSWEHDIMQKLILEGLGTVLEQDDMDTMDPKALFLDQGEQRLITEGSPVHKQLTMVPDEDYHHEPRIQPSTSKDTNPVHKQLAMVRDDDDGSTTRAAPPEDSPVKQADDDHHEPKPQEPSDDPKEEEEQLEKENGQSEDEE